MNLHTVMINEGVDPKLTQESLAINLHLARLRMNPMETNKTFKVWLNPLRFASQNIDAQLHKAIRVQLMELEIKPFQNTDH
jgi:homogentisate 1,2-dioxygenase